MPTLENKISYCEQCGAPLKIGAARVSHCLLWADLRIYPETQRFQHYERVCARRSHFDEWPLARGITYREWRNLGSVVG